MRAPKPTGEPKLNAYLFFDRLDYILGASGAFSVDVLRGGNFVLHGGHL